MSDFTNSLQNTAIGTTVAQSSWLFPAIETVHVLSIVLVVGSILWVDLRLLNVADKGRRVSELSLQLLPVAWVAFALAVTAGALLFISKAHTYYVNTPFRIKMLCIALAGINMLVFQVWGAARMTDWDQTRPPLRARVAGGISLSLWLSIVALGRWIGFTT